FGWNADAGTIDDSTSRSAGAVEFFDGSPNQQLVNADGLPVSTAGYVMTTTTSDHPGSPELNFNGTLDPDLIPGYRGYLSVCLFGIGIDDNIAHWALFTNPAVPGFQFEVASYPTLAFGTPIVGAAGANPADVIRDLITAPDKGALDAARIDTASFSAAATTLFVEGHGYSRCFDQSESVQQMIQEVLAQIDATLYTDPSTNAIKLKLIRPDYDPQTIPLITPDNCQELQGFSLGGWQDIPTKMIVSFPDRDKHYLNNTATAINGSGAATGASLAQIQYPGCCEIALASKLAARELAARSRPIAKCSAIVDRSFYNVCPGDVVAVNWPEANIAGMVFRVAAVDRGTLKDGKIRLDLIQDYFYTWRNNRPVFPGGTGGYIGNAGVAEL
ncbi:MAG TPA: phage tail protein, partial [Chloroflexota bacterium]|nr:phage tail protein [Chloroflexota bacterium]